jgi:chemotaxis protein MotB
MSTSDNPFTSAGNQSRANRGGTVLAWSVAVVALGIAALIWTFSSRARAVQEQQLQALRAELEKTSAELAHSRAAERPNQAVIAALTNQLSELQKQKEQAGDKAKSLEQQMREQLESKDVAISKLQGKLTVTIVDRVMFDSGEAVLKAPGAAVIQKIADLLAVHPELIIQVVGHTDNVPIRQTAQSRFASNWELSVARALAAVHFLIEKAGVDPRRVGAAGYGEFRPTADNSTAEGRAKNRRIAITLLPEELADGDASPNPAGQEVTAPKTVNPASP